jgi:methionine-rich copper-binding protein CopC
MTIIKRATLRDSALAAALLLLAQAGPALAHAHLRSAQPPVDGSVGTNVQDIRIHYSEAVEPRFCQVTVTGPDGHAVEADRPEVDPADAKILVVHLLRALPPGAYKVNWHATAVDTHKTEGSYGFTVTP